MKRQRIDPYTGPTTLGIDVSAYQPDVDWPRVAAATATLMGRPEGRARFAVIRTGDGIRTRRGSIPDPWAVRHLTGGHEAGILMAAYHFIRAHHPAAAQVEIILDVIAVAAVPIGFIALDIEGAPPTSDRPGTGAWWSPNGAPPVTTAEVLACILEMKRLLELAGHRVIIYSGVAWHWYIAQAGLVPPWAAGLDLWTPYYTTSRVPALPVDRKRRPAPWASWRIHQFAGSKKLPGRIAGIRGPVDLNRFRGDEAELGRWWSGVEAIPADRAIPAFDRVPAFDRARIVELARDARDVGDLRAAVKLTKVADQLAVEFDRDATAKST